VFSWRPDYDQLGQCIIDFVASDGAAYPFGPGYAQSARIFVSEAPPRGDLDRSYRIDMADALIAMAVLSRAPLPSSLRPDYVTSGADVNGDNRVGIAELIYILQRLANLL
jgi:hypothetical protein